MDRLGYQKLSCDADAEEKLDLEEALRLYNEETPDRWQKVAAAVGMKAEELISTMMPDSDRPMDIFDLEFIDSIVFLSSVRSISIKNVDDGALTDDGYEWKEFGQKSGLVDPESVNLFYKCKQPSCPAMKRIQRQKDGKITAAYRGIHNHEASKETPELQSNSPDSEMEIQKVVSFEAIEEELDSPVQDKVGLDGPLENLKGYFSLFPDGYEFDEDTLVQLWIAEGFIGEEQEKVDKTMEDIGCEYFNYLLEEGFIVPSGYDHSFRCKIKYRVDESKMGTRLIFQDDKVGDIPKSERRLSLLCKTMDLATFETISRCKNLSTLFLFPNHDPCLKSIPRHLFLSLKLLRILNMSHSCVTELPSSIGRLKSLVYLDISFTPIKWLPEAISCIPGFQILKLKCCLNICELPKCTWKLINLRHLDLDVGRQLISMPIGMGYLTKLQSLSAFIVGEFDGCRIGELKDLNNLRGEFSLLRLENVVNSDEAKEAALCDKRYIEKLELRWSELYGKVNKQEEILESLQPHHDLKELIIYCYGGSKLPSWISSPSYANLVSISFYKCENCQFLPSIGVLPSLKFLYINEMNGVKEIDTHFFKNRTHQGVCAFPKLEKLQIDVMLGLEEWKEIEIGDMPNLLKLTLESCLELVTLPSFSGINSLKDLKIIDCPKLQSLPEVLPASLGFLLVKDCPLLKERCNLRGEDWPKVAHVSSIWIDQEEISPESST